MKGPGVQLLGRFLLFFFCCLAWVGCASTGPSFLAPGRTQTQVEPWTWPDDAFPSQRLYRVKYDGPEGKLGFKLTLYLESADRYRLQSADLVGRKLWELYLEPGDLAIMIDHRNNRYCQVEQASQLAMVPLGRLPLIAIPKLLLGLLPTEPDRVVRPTVDTLTYRDTNGQLWQASWEESGQLSWWTLGEPDDPIAFWRQPEDNEIGGIFSDRRGKQQLRWREVIRETLSQNLARPDIPAKYELGSCQTESASGS